MPEPSKETVRISRWMEASGISVRLRVVGRVFCKLIILARLSSPDIGKGDDRNSEAAMRAVARIEANLLIWVSVCFRQQT